MKIEPSIPFSKPDDLDTMGWDIDFAQFETPDIRYPPTGRLFESPNKKFACCFYAVYEYKMCSYGGPIAIFENKSNPVLLCNPKNTWFTFQFDHTLVPDNGFFFLILLAYNEDKSLSGYPFVVIDLENKQFGFIEFDFTSIYYTPVRVNESLFKLHPFAPDEIKRSQRFDRSNEIIDLTKIYYYDFGKFNNVRELYFTEKKKWNNVNGIV